MSALDALSQLQRLLMSVHGVEETAQARDYLVGAAVRERVAPEASADEALLFKEALEEEGAARARALRRLGDTSLFVSGMFSDSLSSSLVDVEYAIAMGSRAYDALGDVAARHGRGERSVWDELAAKFSQLVEVLNEVSERTLATSNAGLLRIYEKWIKTGSPRVATLLSQHGVAAVIARPKGRFVQ